MKLKILSWVAIIIAIIITIIFLLKIEKLDSVNESTVNELLSIEELEKQNPLDSANDRLDTLRKRIELQWLITRWEMYFNNQEYTTALTQYLQVYNRIPNDNDTNLKIWDIYYNLKRFWRAYEFYSNIKNYPNLDRKKAIYSFLNTIDSKKSWSWELNEINREIDSLWFIWQENFYYKNSTICINDFSLCRLNFEEYFNKFDKTNNEKLSWWEEIENLIEELQNIKNAFLTYENFKIDDLWYKSALVTWAFYVNWFYKIALETSKNILEENKWYKPILKIAAKSAYELWEYIEARDFLIEHNKLESNDAEVSYFLWRVYENLNEKVLSIIHFNRAISNWYNDIADIQRRLIFIYFELNDTDKMLKAFQDLIDSNNKNLNINDYNLAIYFHIINWDLETALKYSNIAKNKYSNSELFYWYYSWIMLQEENISISQERLIENNIKKALEINEENPMILMVKWIQESKKWNFEEALKFFRRAMENDKTKEYSESTKYFVDETIKKMNSKK